MSEDDPGAWLPVREFPAHYEINQLGQLRRLQHYHRGNVGKLRKPQYDKKGYMTYMLSVANKVYLRYAHRMVADAFKGPIPEGLEVNHEDGDKGRPHLSNLTIMTNGENRAHSYRVLGVAPNCPGRNEESPTAKLTWEAVRDIRRRYAAGGVSYKQLGDVYGVTKTTIMYVVKQMGWRDEDDPANPSSS